MKSDRFPHPVAGTSKGASVAIGAERNAIILTIKISTKGSAQKALIQPKHQARLRQEVEHLVDGVLNTSRPAASVRRLANQLQDAASPTRTKEAKCTIGVTTTEYLRDEIKQHAQERGLPAAEVAREMFEQGFGAFQDRLWSEPSSAVIADYKEAYAEFLSDTKKQWMLRLSRRQYLKAVLLAKEQGLSQSELVCYCLATAALAFAAA